MSLGATVVAEDLKQDDLAVIVPSLENQEGGK